MGRRDDRPTKLARWWRRPAGGRAVLALALPLILSTASWTIMHFVDRVFLTWYSPQTIAAAMPAGMVHFTMLSLPLGIAGYINTFVSQYFGANEKKRIGLAVWQGVFIGMASIPLFLATYPFAPSLFAWARHDPAIQVHEVTYFRTLSFGAGAAVISAALASFFTGLGRSRVVMVVNFAAAGLNIVSDYLLIFGQFGFPELGILGAGITTVISLWFKVFVYGWLLSRAEFREPYGLVQGRRIDWSLLGRLLRFGGPSGVQVCLEMIAFSTFMLLLGRLGEVPLAATTVAFSINAFAFVPMLGLGVAVTTMVGQNLGRNRPDLATRATWSALAIGTAYTLVMIFLYLAVPGVFLLAHAAGSHDPEFQLVRETCVLLLRFAAVYCLWDMVHIVFVSAIKGAGDTRFVLLTTLLLSPLPVVLGHFGLSRWNWNLWNFWTVITVWICLLGTIYAARFLQGRWQRMRVIERELLEPATPVAVG